jgi:c-di-GMP-binding flagellar brake protein YcgR
MPTNTPTNLRRWERQPATIPITLGLKAENLIEDDSATIINFSLGGVGVLTTLALVPGERVRIVDRGKHPRAIPALVVWLRKDESSHATFAGLQLF